MDPDRGGPLRRKLDASPGNNGADDVAGTVWIASSDEDEYGAAAAVAS